MPEISRILLAQSPEAISSQGSALRELLESRLGATVGFASSPQDVAAGSHYDVVIAPTVPWLPELLQRLEAVQWVHFLSAGVERIWSMDVNWSNLLLTKSSGVHAAPMSEYAIGAMLYFAKSFDQFVAQSRDRNWSRVWLDELTDKNLLILGLGSVGGAVADRARAFGMSVTGVVRTPRGRQTEFPVHTLDDLPTLLPETDVVVVTMPLTEETRDLVGSEFFSHLRAGAILVDMSRGGIVDEDAVIEALETRTLRGAAVDVFEREPLPADSRLWDRTDVLLTPHVAGTTPHYMERALEIFCRNVEALERGEPLITPVEVERGY